MRKTPYYEEIYRHILRLLYTGQLLKGDTLDSIEILCERYGASPNTIRTVIRKLSSAGFITTGRGKPTTVVSTVGDHKKAFAQICACHDKIADVYDLLRILLPSIAVYSLKRLRREDVAELSSLMDLLEEHCQEEEAFRQYLSRLIHTLMSGTDNPLIQETINQSESIIMIPRMLFDRIEKGTEPVYSGRRHFAQRLRLAIESGLQGRFEAMNRQFYETYTWNKQFLCSNIVQPVETAAPDTCFLEENNYLYEAIVSDIIGLFYEGFYGAGDMLPSEGAMCKRYGVSMPTVKKAYKILAELGVTRTMNGKGTQVTLFSEIKESEPCRDRMTHLSSFMEIMELITITVKDMAVYATDCLKSKEVTLFEERLRDLWARREDRHVHTLPLLLFELVRWTGCGALASLYQEVRKRLIWSIYLDRFLPNAQAEWENRHYLCLSALDEWKRGDPQRFGMILEDAMAYCLNQYQTCFDRQIQLLSA